MQQFYCRPVPYGPSILTGSPLPSAIQGQPYSVTLVPRGGTPPYTFALISGSLDVGLTLSLSGVISGTPVFTEVDTLGIQVTDVHGGRGPVQIFSLTIVSSLLLVGETLPPATFGVPYSQNISGQASGGVLPYVFSLLSATGPDTWFVSTTGVITGTPNIPGTDFLVTGDGVPIVTDAGVQLTT